MFIPFARDGNGWLFSPVVISPTQQRLDGRAVETVTPKAKWQHVCVYIGISLTMSVAGATAVFLLYELALFYQSTVIYIREAFDYFGVAENMPSLSDCIGFAAATCVVMTFCVNSRVSLRCFAILSNGLFMTYAARVGLRPIFILHSILLPINIIQLTRIVLRRKRDRAVAAPDPR